MADHEFGQILSAVQKKMNAVEGRTKPPQATPKRSATTDNNKTNGDENYHRNRKIKNLGISATIAPPVELTRGGSITTISEETSA